MIKDIKIINGILEKIWESTPKIKTELEYKTDFQLLLAVILSAQTTDKQVNLATKRFFEKVKKPEDMMQFQISELESYFKTLNYFRNKAKSIYLSAQMLISEFSSEVPDTLEGIMRLPWVWIKTAKVVLWVLKNAPYVWVDTHVHRVCNRIWICRTKDPKWTDDVLDKILDDNMKRKIHHSLVLFWRYTCTARTPKCKWCPIVDECEFKEKNI